MKKSIDQNESCSPELVARTTVGGDKRIAMIRLNRPSRANAYNSEMLNLIESAVRTNLATGKIHALIITGSGERAFCAGADRDELRTRRAEDGLDLRSREIFEYLAALPIPTVAAINGAAIGGGLELALACDIRVCAPTAKFSFPELSFGLSPAAGGMDRLPPAIGKSRAKEMILFGREIDAPTALDWGLVSYVCDDYEAKALALAEWAAAQDSLAMRLSKRIIDSNENSGRLNLNGVTQALLYERKFQKKG